MKAMVIMIMAVNPPESFPTSGLDSMTSVQLQRLVFLNNKSQDAYQISANLATDRRLVDLSQQAVIERQDQATTLQNILWCNGTPSRTEPRGETESDRRIYKVLNESPQWLLTTLIDELLKIDEQISECYESVNGSIQGRGIRQLLTEQAVRIQRRRKSVLDLRLQIANSTSSQTEEAGRTTE